ncbi:Ndufb3p [Halocaridina rubra]|uniref:NADH dehydrogenase [ubiquinone] 1 beta subcomplex subunit 3 n=1 Tax=Halocaridina rubra TaxID=373956 RepID=A0AAN8X6B3_HALRR
MPSPPEEEKHSSLDTFNCRIELLGRRRSQFIKSFHFISKFKMGGGHTPYKVPDWRIYKIENAPELVQVQRALASHGLKDPWLRNEVWRYNQQEFGTHWARFRLALFRGFKWGLLAAVATVALERTLGGGGHGHGHGDHH